MKWQAFRWWMGWGVLALFLLGRFAGIERSDAEKPNHRPIYWDAISYYCYLPALFVEGDLSMEFTRQGDYSHQYWPETTPTGGLVSKTTMGIAFLYAPFFGLAHLAATLGPWEADGFSRPYHLAIQFSGLFYGLWGLWLLGHWLRRFVGDGVVAATLILLTLGTNLFNYITHEAAMSHAFNFFAIAALLYLTERWHDAPSAAKSAAMGLLIGLITLIRPTNLAVILVPLLYGLGSPLFTAKWRSLKQHPHWVLYIVLGAFVVGLPQLLYWKAYSGQWLFFSYTGERFFWDQPMWLEFLLSYRKGWWVYSPLILLAFAGLFFRHPLNSRLRWPIVLLMPLLVYVLSCWWAWWFGGGFGSRPMVDWYALLAAPLAVFLARVWQKRWQMAAALLLCAGLVELSMKQQQQYRLGILHYDAMTRKAYWAIFYNRPVPADFESLIQPPNYAGNKAGKREKVDVAGF